MQSFSQVIALKQSAAEQFVDSADFKKLDSDNLVAAEFESEEGHKLYLFSPTTCGLNPPHYLDPEDYVWIQVDSEDNMAVEGYWEDYPFDLDVHSRMSLVIHSDEEKVAVGDYSTMKEYVAFLKESFDTSKLDFGSDSGAECDFGDCGSCLLCQGWEEDCDEARLFHKSSFDTSYSTDRTFLAVFYPDLKAIIRYKEVIEEITGALCDELTEPMEGAYSAWRNQNVALISRLCEEGALDYPESLTNVPGINVYGATDNLHDGFEGNLGWHELQLPDESTGIRLVRSTVEIGKATRKKD